MKKNTFFRSPRELTDDKINIINDPACSIDKKVKSRDEIKLLLAKSKLLRFYYRCRIYIKNSFLYQKAIACKNSFISKLFIIEPDNKWKILWDFLIIFFYLCLFFIMGIQFSFDMFLLEELFPNNYTLQFTIQICINMIVLLDIFLKCFTAYYKNGILVKNSQKIFRNYIYSYFIYDFMAIVPILLETYILLFDHRNFSKTFYVIIKISQLLIYAKSFEVSRVLDTLDDMLQLEEKSQALFNIIKLIIEILLFSHIIACSWHAVSIYSPYHETLLETDDLIHKEWFYQYLGLLFWTISPEKIDPRNELEYGFGFFAVLGSHAVFGFIIEGIHSIVESLGEKKAQMKNDMKIINKIFDKKNISYDLQMKIRKYFYFLHEHQSTGPEIEASVINKLSSSLKDEMLLKANGRILQSIPLFSENFSQRTIQDLVISMKKVCYYPEEIIYKQGENHDHSLYLIDEGEIHLSLDPEIIGNKKTISLKKLEKGEFFGETSFFTDSKRDNKSMSNSFSTLYVLRKEDFIRIVSERPEDYEKYCMIRDKMMIYHNLESLNKKCTTCNKRDHNIYTCPDIHYVPRKEFIIKRYLYSKPQLERSKIIRFKKKRGNVLKFLNKIQEGAFLFDTLNSNSCPEEIINEEGEDNFTESDIDEIPDSPLKLNSPQIKSKKIDNSEIKPFEIVLKEEEDVSSPMLIKNRNLKELMNDNKNVSSSEYLEIKQENNNKRRDSKLNNYKKIPSFNATLNAHNNHGLQKMNSNETNVNWENGFERMHIFTQYFCNNNADVVLNSYDQYLTKKLNRINKLRNIKKKRTMMNNNSPPPVKSRSRFFLKDYESENKKSINFIGSEDCKSFIQLEEKSILQKDRDDFSISSRFFEEKKN